MTQTDHFLNKMNIFLYSMINLIFVMKMRRNNLIFFAQHIRMRYFLKENIHSHSDTCVSKIHLLKNFSKTLNHGTVGCNSFFFFIFFFLKVLYFWKTCYIFLLYFLVVFSPLLIWRHLQKCPTFWRVEISLESFVWAITSYNFRSNAVPTKLNPFGIFLLILRIFHVLHLFQLNYWRTDVKLIFLVAVLNE